MPNVKVSEETKKKLDEVLLQVMVSRKIPKATYDDAIIYLYGKAKETQG